MNQPPILPQQERESPDPVEQTHRVPYGVLALVGALLIFGMVYIIRADLQNPAVWGDGRAADEWMEKKAVATAGRSGAAIYAALCLACHQATGQGLPGVFPPLAGSEWVVGSERTLTAIVLHGVTGPIQVAGKTYDGSMPAFGAQLTDVEMAALLTHLRTQWGHQAAPISPQLVADVRAATQSRTKPFEGEKALRSGP